MSSIIINFMQGANSIDNYAVFIIYANSTQRMVLSKSMISKIDNIPPLVVPLSSCQGTSSSVHHWQLPRQEIANVRSEEGERERERERQRQRQREKDRERRK